MFVIGCQSKTYTYLARACHMRVGV